MSELQTASGKNVHPIGIGTWGIGGNYEPNRSNDVHEIDALRYSLSKGQNHIDTAEMYGGGFTDEIVGRAIRGAERKNLFIADKLWRKSVAKGKARTAVEGMLAKLDTEYIDLLYVHAPWPDEPWLEAVPQINDLIDAGLVRQLGVSNFDVEDMKRVAAISKHPIMANQLLYNVLNKAQVQAKVQEYCRLHNITIVAYRPVERSAVLENAVVQDVAQTHGATAAQVALAWLLAKGTLPIPKAVSKPHIDENLGALDFALTTAELERLDAL